MAVQYAIEFADTHLEVSVSGVPDRESIVQMWFDITAACRENDCFRVLGLSSTERAIELKDALQYAKIFEQVGVTPNYRIAWVQANPASFVMIELIVEMLRNRKLAEGEVFKEEAEARRWLAEDG